MAPLADELLALAGMLESGQLTVINTALDKLHEVLEELIAERGGADVTYSEGRNQPMPKGFEAAITGKAGLKVFRLLLETGSEPLPDTLVRLIGVSVVAAETDVSALEAVANGLGGKFGIKFKALSDVVLILICWGTATTLTPEMQAVLWEHVPLLTALVKSLTQAPMLAQMTDTQSSANP